VTAALAGLALTVLVLALARPARAERVPREEASVVLVMDVSSSMEATDVPPSRLAAAVDAADAFVAEVPDEVQVGLVTFDRTARVVTIPGADHVLVRQALHRLTTRRGTDTAAALDAALESLPPGADGRTATIVLLSDGGTEEAPVAAAAREAADRGVPVNTIAYGTDGGTVEVDGETEAVPADPAAMRRLADATGGSSFRAATVDQLRAVYQDIQGRVSYTTERRELVGAFLVAGVVVLAAAFAASMLWTARFL